MTSAALLTLITGIVLATARNLGLPSEATLYHRFVGWTLGRDRTCRVCGSRRHDVLPGLPPRLFPCDKLHEDLRQDVRQDTP